MPVRRFGYLRWQTNDLAAWRHFAVDVLGFMEVDSGDPNVLWFRWDEEPFRLQVVQGDVPELLTLGFEVADDLEMDTIVGLLGRAEVPVDVASPDEADERRVAGLIRFSTPSGLPVELFYEPVLDHVPLVTPLVSGFVTGEMGLGHAVVSVDDLQRETRFWRETLGFHRRNTYTRNGIEMGFFGCNPRHHTLAFAQGFVAPGRLSHFMVEAKTIDDVGYALDRCLDNGVAVVSGLGRHTNDRMVSFYCAGPDGPNVEFGWGGLHVEDPASETTYAITKPSFWGHRPLKA